jgi:hypothetical protein
MPFDSRTHLFTNNADGRLASNINDSQTSIALESGQGARFPSPASGEIFKLTVYKISTGEREIMHVTARSGDTLTVERGAEGTTALTFDAASPCLNSITAGTLEWLQSLVA